MLHIKATTARRDMKITFVPTHSFYFFLYEQVGSVYKMPSACQRHKGNPHNLVRPITLSCNMVPMMLRNTLKEQNPFSGLQNRAASSLILALGSMQGKSLGQVQPGKHAASCRCIAAPRLWARAGTHVCYSWRWIIPPGTCLVFEPSPCGRDAQLHASRSIPLCVLKLSVIVSFNVLQFLC